MTEIAGMPGPEAIKRSRRMLMLLVVLFFGPMIASWLFIKYGADRVDLAPVSYGELVSPAITLKPFVLSTGAVDLQDVQGIWTLLYPLKGECDASCGQLLHDTRQVRTALAKEMGRLQRVVLWENQDPAATLPLADVTRHPALRVFRGNATELLPLWSQLPDEAETALFLVDPMGNVMMRYPLDFEGKPLLKELNFLLKHSVLG